MPLGTADNAGLLADPFLHLREGVPKVAMIQLLESIVVLSHSGRSLMNRCEYLERSIYLIGCMRRDKRDPQPRRPLRHGGWTDALSEHTMLEQTLRKAHTAIGIADHQRQDLAPAVT